jgi:hypothetical protein
VSGSRIIGVCSRCFYVTFAFCFFSSFPKGSPRRGLTHAPYEDLERSGLK